MYYVCSSKGVFIVAKIFDKRGRLLSYGHNSYVTDPSFFRFAKPLNEPYRVHQHAEWHAIKRLKFTDIERVHTIKIYRFNANGEPVLAKPCRICSRIIESFPFKKIEYTDVGNPLDMTYEEYKTLLHNATHRNN